MDNSVAALTSLYNRIADINNAAALLEWDQETYMPRGAANARAHQIATLRALGHELATSDELGQALDAAGEANEASGEEDGYATALVRVGRRDYDKSTRLSPAFVEESARAEAHAKSAWREAREEDDYSRFAPHLEAVVALNREKAELLGYEDHPYDALLDQFEPDTTTSDIDAAFSELRDQLVPIVTALRGRADGRADILRRSFPSAIQWKVGEELIASIGYDFDRGRQDKSAHPFCTTFSISDVRITTRVDPNFFSPAFFGTLHEMGHALYEQGIDPALERTPLADGTSLGIHESQSRLWENLVGRSAAFIDFFFPTLQRAFGDSLSDVSARQFYRAANAVKPSLIRVEADEVTYNLHVMMRFELERSLFEGALTVADLRDAWNEKMRDYLGVVPTRDADGVLQDIHWSMGAFGYFPTYSIGNLMASQFYDVADRDLGGIDKHVSEGRFAPLVEWLGEHIHRYGRTKSANELLRDITGGGLSASPWLRYIRKKYAALYDVNLD